MILSRRSHHGRPADVDHLDARQFGERVEIGHHQIDGHDAPRFQFGHVIGVGPVGEDPAVDRRVECLDPSAQHLGSAGDLGDLGDGHALVGQQRGGAPAGYDLPAEVDEATGQVDDAGLVVDGKQGAGTHSVAPTTCGASSNRRIVST